MKKIRIKNLGPIHTADIEFGDLTFFVGPQASGKSILLQLIKLLRDKEIILSSLSQYGYVLNNDTDKIIDRYFGEGMSAIWTKTTRVAVDEIAFSKSKLLPKLPVPLLNIDREHIYYIPAQRVVCVQNGWPRFFTDYEDSVPYVLKHFSENLRQFLESDFGLSSNETIFPKKNELSSSLQDSFNQSIFHDGRIVLDQSVKKRFKLIIGNTSIPYMAWSAGQKEFMPLLLSFYHLCPPGKKGRLKGVEYVIIEEPEMGLHPQAIESVILQMLNLIGRGYKVIVSTHSPVLLEFAWAFHLLKSKKGSPELLAELFGVVSTSESLKDFSDFLQKRNIKSYHFDRNEKGVMVKDISSLDASDQDESISEWGGLSSFSSRASNIISKMMSSLI